MEDAPIDPPPRPMRLEPLGLVDLIDLHGETINIAKYAQALACELATRDRTLFGEVGPFNCCSASSPVPLGSQTLALRRNRRPRTKGVQSGPRSLAMSWK